MSLIISTFVVACLVSLAVVPLVRIICEKIQLTDRPDGHRKLHQVPVALGGGIAAFISTLAVCSLVFLLWNRVSSSTIKSSEDSAWLVDRGDDHPRRRHRRRRSGIARPSKAARTDRRLQRPHHAAGW